MKTSYDESGGLVQHCDKPGVCGHCGAFNNRQVGALEMSYAESAFQDIVLHSHPGIERALWEMLLYIAVEVSLPLTFGPFVRLPVDVEGQRRNDLRESLRVLEGWNGCDSYADYFDWCHIGYLEALAQRVVHDGGVLSIASIDEYVEETMADYTHIHRYAFRDHFYIRIQPTLPDVRIDGKRVRPDALVTIPSRSKFRVLVELDGWKWHGDRESFRRDRERSAELETRGYRVRRIAGSDITRKPFQTAVRLFEYLCQIKEQCPVDIEPEPRRREDIRFNGVGFPVTPLPVSTS